MFALLFTFLHFTCMTFVFEFIFRCLVLNLLCRVKIHYVSLIRCFLLIKPSLSMDIYIYRVSVCVCFLIIEMKIVLWFLGDELFRSTFLLFLFLFCNSFFQNLKLLEDEEILFFQWLLGTWGRERERAEEKRKKSVCLL